MNDADIEMTELAEQANLEAHLRRQGICTHPAVAGRMGAAQHGHVPATGSKATLMCWDCGTWFADDDAWYAARDDILAEYQ